MTMPVADISEDDMNAAVAVALGIPVDPNDDGDVWIDGETWCPAYNWDDAMNAAERFGLFKVSGNPTGPCLVFSHGSWEIWKWIGGGEFDDTIASAPTGPMAICRAIMKLHADARHD